MDDPAGPGAREVHWRAAPTAAGSVLGAGPLQAWWDGPAESVPARGVLVADDHGQVPEQVRPVTATVLSVRVVRQAYHRTGLRTYEPIAGAFTLRPVAVSPRSFHLDSPEPPPDTLQEESGVLLGLRVD